MLVIMNNEGTQKAQKQAEQAKDRERMARILKEDKMKTARRGNSRLSPTLPRQESK
jgi:hypothetical protein